MTAGSRLVAAAAVLALAGVAHAQAPSEADEAFRRGRELLKAGKHAEACEQFERSQRLDPQLGTRFNIAQCGERIGRLATALAIYRDLAANDINPQRKATAAELAAQLEARVPRLVVQVANPPPSLALELAGPGGKRPIEANRAVPLDFGSYAVAVRAEGFAELALPVEIREEGRTTTLVAVLAPAAAPAEQPEPPAAPTPEAPPRSSRKLIAFGLIGAGGAALIGGSIAGLLARSSWNEARDACGGDTTCGSDDELERATAFRADASTRATISTALFAGAGLLAAAGVVLWATAPSERQVRVAARAGADGAGVILMGRF